MSSLTVNADEHRPSAVEAVRGNYTTSTPFQETPERRQGPDFPGFFVSDRPKVPHETARHCAAVGSTFGGIWSCAVSNTAKNTDTGTMPLNDAQIRNAKPTERACRLSDGGGMFLEVSPSGARYWRLSYRVGVKQETLALGVYPAVSLRDQNLDFPWGFVVATTR
jgi:hypothetical protein